MPIPVTITTDDPDALLHASMYGTGAVIRLHSSTTETGTYASVGTAALVSGIRAYTIYDTAGTTTTWYRSRYENSGATVVSDWSTSFQVGESGICSLADVRQRLGITSATDTASDEELLEFIAEVTADITGYTGRRFVRSPLAGTSTFLFDVSESSRTLWVPQGIANLTTLEIATTSQPESGGTYTTATSTDYMLRPVTHERAAGWPATRIVFRDGATGPVTAFSAGHNTVRVTGALGWATVPADVAGIAQRAVVRRFKNRGAATVNRGGDPSDVSVRWTFSLEEQRKLDWYRARGVA